MEEVSARDQAGCEDGPRGGPLLSATTTALAPTHAIGPAGLLTLEQGVCDLRWRLRRLDLDSGQMQTVFTAEHSSLATPELESLLEPQAVLDLGQGRYLIADSDVPGSLLYPPNISLHIDIRGGRPGFGNGVWLLDATQGQLQKLAGFAIAQGRRVDFQDGQGPTASFLALTKLCPTTDPQRFYALDGLRPRILDLDGRVTTLKPDGNRLRGLVCGKDGQALTALHFEADQSGQWPTHVTAVMLPGGQQYTLPPRDYANLVALAGEGKAWLRRVGTLQLYDLARAEPIEGAAVQAQDYAYHSRAFAPGEGQTLYFATDQNLMSVQAD